MKFLLENITYPKTYFCIHRGEPSRTVDVNTATVFQATLANGVLEVTPSLPPDNHIWHPVPVFLTVTPGKSDRD